MEMTLRMKSNRRALEMKDKLKLQRERDLKRKSRWVYSMCFVTFLRMDLRLLLGKCIYSLSSSFYNSFSSHSIPQQLYQNFISIQLSSEWQDQSTVQYFTTVTQAFSIQYWFVQFNLSWTTFIFAYYGVILLVFFIIINFMYASFSVSNQGHQLSFTWPLTLLQYMCLLMTTVLFQPLLQMLLSMMACQSITVVTNLIPASASSNSSAPATATTSVSSNVLALTMYNDVVCFQGIHILHAALGIIVAIVLIALALTIVFLYYESRKQNHVIVSKVHARVEVVVTLVKLLLVIVFTLLQDPSFMGFKILVLVISSSVTFIKFHFERPYYNRNFNKVMCVIHAIFAWSNCMILLGAVFVNLMFNMLIVIYLLGIPIIIALIVTMKDNAEFKILLTPMHKFQKGEEALSQVIQLIYLIQTKETNRESAILIKGFVNYHEMSCIDDECVLKQYKKQHMQKQGNSTNHRSQSSSFENTSSNSYSNNSQVKLMLNESNSLLLNFTKKLLEKSIRRFPKCTILKITYSNFLLDHMGNKREAMRELKECTKLGPQLDQQFIIYRYKKLIGDSLIESGKESGGFEYISAVNFDSNFRKCKLNIERTSLLHFEFWNHLQEDSPDLGRLMDLGIRIDQQIKIIDHHWERMQQIYPNTPKAVKLYAMFLIEVINDKEAGNELLQKAKDISAIRVNADLSNNQGGGDDMSGMGSNLQDGSPIIYISGENDRMGQISNINLAACRIFGYLRREELIGKNLRQLMPHIYSQFHDEFIRTAVMKTAEQLNNKERSVFGKHTSNYIFPVSLQIKFFQSFLHGKQFAATLKTEKKGINSSVAYLIIDERGHVLEASSSNHVITNFLGAANLLDIDKNSTQQIKKKVAYDLTVLIDGLLNEDRKQVYLGKQGDKVIYHYPEFVENLVRLQSQMTNEQSLKNQKTEGSEESSDEDADQDAIQRPNAKKSLFAPENKMKKQATNTKDDNVKYDTVIKASEEKKQYFLCNMTTISFPMIEGGAIQGYSVRLEMDETENEIAEKQFLLEQNIQDPVTKKLVKCNDFQFSFNPIYKKFVRELKDDENQDPLIDSAYMYVKKENMKRTEDQPKLTVMAYLNHLKVKLEKQEETNSAALMSDDYFIREVDEYSEETHSDDMYQHTATRKQMTQKEKLNEGNDSNKFKIVDDQGRSMQKRVNEILNQRFIPGVETPEKLFEKIQEITEILKEKSRAGDGIKTYRVNGEDITLVEEVTGQFLIKSTEQTHVEVEEIIDDDVREEDEGDGFKTNLKSRKAFQTQLNDKAVPPSVKKLQYTANLVLLIFITLVIIEYSVVRSVQQDISTNFVAIQNRFQLISEMQRSCYHVRSLVLSAKKLYQMDNFQLGLSKSDMASSLDNIYNLQSQINAQQLTLSPPHQQLMSSKVVQMYFKQDQTTQNIQALNFSLTEGLLQISSSLFTLTNLDNSQFSDSEDDVFYFLYNNFQDTLSSMWQSAFYYVSELQVRTGALNEANQIVFYLSITCIVVSVLGLIPVVHIVNKTKQQYLEVFLDLDNNSMRKLSSKCEKYMNMIQDENNEEINSSDEELEEMARVKNDANDEEYAQANTASSRRSKKKRAKNTISNKRMFVIKFVIGMMIIEIYFFFNYFTQLTFLSTCFTMSQELNITATVEPFFWFGMNAQRELYNDATRTIMGQNSFLVSMNAIAQVQQLGSDMQQQHLQNMGQASSDYNSVFSNTMLNSVCSIIDPNFENYTSMPCEQFISGLTTQGLHTVIVRYEEGLRSVLSTYELINKKSVQKFQALLNSEAILDLFNIERFITSVHMEDIITTLQNSVQSSVNQTLELRLALFTLFIVLLLLLFVTVWIPFINSLTSEVHQTKRILLLIPIELLIGLKNIATLLNEGRDKLNKGSTPASGESSKKPGITPID